MVSPLYKKFAKRFVREHMDEYNTCMRLAEKAKQEGKKQEKHWLNEAEEAITKANYYQTLLNKQQEK